jgi:quinoprotein glucose dehydrogenase
MKNIPLFVITALLAACSYGKAGTGTTQGSRTADWPYYGGDAQASRFSPLAEINRNNVGQLELAWTHRSNDFNDGSDGKVRTSLQVTPILQNNTLYYCSPTGKAFALDPETGVERWAFDPAIRSLEAYGPYPAVCRGVAYWENTESDNLDTPCQRRILYGTRDAELIALDADTGKLCQDFGTAGRVSLREGIEGSVYEYYPTSPPVIIDNKAVIGALVADNVRTNSPSGVVRAFDVRSGTLSWAWDPVPDDYKERHRDESGRVSYTQGSPNVWAPMSFDTERNLIFVPTGNPGADLYGGQRDGIDFYGSSVVALHAATGKVAWHFQTVHHDVWDYDVASQPQLFRHPGIGNGRPGLLQATKTGNVFLLDRESGKPLYPVEERPVPQNGVPGEQLSPTQPFPTHPKPLHKHTLSADELFGFIGFDKRECRKLFEKHRYDGIYTPPTLEGSIMYPGSTGGMNWGSTSIDNQRGIMYVAQMHYAQITTLIPRAEYDALNPVNAYPNEYYAMAGSDYGVKRVPFMSRFDAPCLPLPWGSLMAVDLKSGETLWQRFLGTSRDIAPFPFWFNTGTPIAGGTLVTAGGLLFVGATTDKYFRAFDTETGKELWRTRLETTANATPMSYKLDTNSPQYIVVAAGGHGWSAPSDKLLAYKLVKK